MATASEIFTKTPAENKWLLIDCRRPLAGSTIDTVGAPTQETDGTGTLTLSNPAANQTEIVETGRPRLPIGSALEVFAAGGIAGETYEIRIPFTDVRGQTIEAVITLVVTP